MKHVVLLAIALEAMLLFAPTASAQTLTGHWEYFTNSSNNTSVADDGNYFWTSSWGGGLVRFKKSDHSNTVIPHLNGGLAKSPNGRIWLLRGGLPVGPMYFDGSNWQSPVWATSYYTSGTTFDPQGALWAIAINSQQKGLLEHYDGTAWQEQTIPANDSIPFIPQGILIDHQDNIWITGIENPSGTDYTRYGYSVVARIHDTTMTVWKQEDGLPPSAGGTNFTGIALDSSGNVWVGRYQGVSKFNGTSWTSITRSATVLQSGGSHLLVDQKGMLWCSDYYGVSSYDGNKWTNFPCNDPVSYLSASNEVWAISASGAFRIANGVMTKFGIPDGLPDSACLGAAVDAEGDMIVGTDKGPARFANGSWSSYATPPSPLGNQGGQLTIDHTGNVWIAGQRDDGVLLPGVAEYDGTTWKSYSAKDGLVNDTTISVRIDKSGTPWVATQRGLSSFKNGHWSSINIVDTATAFRTYYSVACDSLGSIWSSSNNIHWDPDGTGHGWSYHSAILYYYDGDWKEYTQDYTNQGQPTGLPPAVINIEISRDGVIYGSAPPSDSSGLYHFDPETGRWIKIYCGIQQANQLFETDEPFLVAKDGTIWKSYVMPVADTATGTKDGPISHFDGRSWQYFDCSRGQIPGAYVLAMSEEPNGNILASSELGIVEYNGTSWGLCIPIDSLGLTAEATSIGLAPDGSYWVTTQTNGVEHFIPGSTAVTSSSTAIASAASAWPNPFHSSTEVDYRLLRDGFVTIGAYNVLGERVAEIVSGDNEIAGNHRAVFESQHLAEGIYHIVIQTTSANGTETIATLNTVLMR